MTPPRQIAEIRADADAGILTVALADRPEDPYCLPAAALYQLLNETPEQPGNPDPKTQFQLQETAAGERQILLTPEPGQEPAAAFPVDLALLLFHYAGIPDHGEGNATAAITGPEIPGWREHPLNYPGAIEEGWLVLEFFAHYAEPDFAATAEPSPAAAAPAPKAKEPPPRQLPLE